MGPARHGTKHGWHGIKVARHGTVGTFDTSTCCNVKKDIHIQGPKSNFTWPFHIGLEEYTLFS